MRLIQMRKSHTYVAAFIKISQSKNIYNKYLILY